ncbi:MAG: hypothetical protein ABFS34_15715 [Gemmatimonadota bacterium]
MRRFILALAIAVCAPSGALPSDAQSPPTLAAGDSVRFAVPGFSFEGSVVEIAGDTVTYRGPGLPGTRPEVRVVQRVDSLHILLATAGWRSVYAPAGYGIEVGRIIKRKRPLLALALGAGWAATIVAFCELKESDGPGFRSECVRGRAYGAAAGGMGVMIALGLILESKRFEWMAASLPGSTESKVGLRVGHRPDGATEVGFAVRWGR